jgi:hypothetical protein
MTAPKRAAGALLLALAACADPKPAATPTPRAVAAAEPSPAAATITPADMYRRVAFLSSDAMRGRDTPSPGLEAAAAYLVGEYTRLGLEPGGENGTFYQRYPMRSLGLDTGTVHFGTLVGTDMNSNQMLAWGRDFYAMPGSVADANRDMRHGGLVYVGAIGDAGLPQADYQGNVPVAALHGAYSRAWRAEATRLRRLAKAAGASAVVLVVDSAFPDDTFTQLARTERTLKTEQGEEGQIPAFYVTYRAFQAIAARAAGGVRFATARTPLALTGVEAHFSSDQRLIQDSRPPNVVAILRGSDPVLRDEYVVLSAHLDHVGVGQPVRGDSIYNGADDDASGTAAILEVAEAMASRSTRPRRSVIFLHVSGEEKGLLGSRWFSDHPTVPIKQIVADVNVDMIGRNSPDTVVVIGKNYSSLGKTVNDVQAQHPELGLTISDDIWPEERFFFRSDHYNFARKDIPAIFFFSGVHEDYHRPSDEVEKLNVDKAARIARSIFYTVDAVANADGRPQWDPRGLAEVRALTR